MDDQCVKCEFPFAYCICDSKSSSLEKTALFLIKQGFSTKEVEQKLGHEFIFFKDQFKKEYHHATFWK